MNIVHIASFDVKPTIGAGRASFFWKEAFIKKGYGFYHIGLSETGKIPHILLFGHYAEKYLRKSNIKPDVIIAHEPAAGFFARRWNVPVVLFSHGTEERCWEVNRQYKFDNISFKAGLVPQSLRFYGNNKGFKHADLIMLSNKTDYDYVIARHNVPEKNLFIFNNGYFQIEQHEKRLYTNGAKVEIVFNASWLPRKGKDILIAALQRLAHKGISNFRLTLAGVGDRNNIMSDIPADMHSYINIIERFELKDEKAILNAADIFVLPSYYEGQSLALTQAMAASKCCLVSDNCGQIDFIRNKENGLLFKTGSVDSLAESFEFIINNTQYVNKLGDAAYQSVRHLTWDHVTNRILEKVEALL